MPAAATLRPLVTDLTGPQLAEWCIAQGQKGFRADQIRRWIFGRRANSFEEMHDVPLALRNALAGHFDFFGSEVTRHQVSKDGTEKLLLTLRDGEQIETVLMREEGRRTICVSSQVGCAMGCIFCASGLNGVKRNLSMGEILDQVLRIDRLLPLEERITNLVVMGMGEPLANLKNVLPALETLNQKGGMGIGARRITVSTVGLPEKIREFAKVGYAYNLAVSLHAPNDELRTQIVPVNKNIGIEEILKAADEHFDATGRRVTYEYCLLAGINDDPAQARELVRLMRGRVAHVNIIPMNPVDTIACQTPSLPRTQAFVETLERGGIVVTVRKRKGADIDAACGQLRINAEKSEVKHDAELAVLQVN